MANERADGQVRPMSSTLPTVQFSLRGLPIRIDAGFVLVALVIGTAVQGTGGFLAGAAVVALLVLAHEFGHALVAQAFGLTPRIRLHWLGGETYSEALGDLSRPRRLLLVVAGPAAGVAVGTLAAVVGRDEAGMAHDVALLAFWVGAVLGAANLLPIYPLDGGLVLYDLLPGSSTDRLRRARRVSVVVAAAAALALAASGELWLAAYPAYLAFANMVKVPPPGGSDWEQLATAMHTITPDSAAEHEAFARSVLASRPAPEVASAAAALVVVAHLVRGDELSARGALVEFQHIGLWETLRQLAVLGAAAEPLLQERMTAGPTEFDVRSLAIHHALQQHWPGVVALVESDDVSHFLDFEHLLWLQTRAFRTGAFLASTQIGAVAEQRPDAWPHFAYNVACGWARAGDPQRALDALQRAVAAGWSDGAQVEHDDDLESVRALPGYEAVRRELQSGGRQRTPVRARSEASRTGAAIGLLGAAALVVATVSFVPDDPLSAFPAGIRDALRTDVVALDLATGDERWRLDLDAAYATVSAADELVGIASYSIGASPERPRGVVGLYDAASGRSVFTVSDATMSLVGTSDTHVIVTVTDTERHEVRGYGRGGDLEWSAQTLEGQAFLVGGVVAVTGYEGPGIEVVDAETGEPLWERDDLYAVVQEGDDLLIAESENGHRVAALEPRTGAEIWTVEVDDRPRVLDRHVWIDQSARERMLVDKATGAAHTIAVSDAAADPIIETGDAVLLRTGTGVELVDAGSGAVRWQHEHARVSTAYEVDDVIVVQVRDRLVAHDAATGLVRWEVPAPTESQVVGGPGVALVLDASGGMRAIDVRTGTQRWSFEGDVPLFGAAVVGPVVVTPR